MNKTSLILLVVSVAVLAACKSSPNKNDSPPPQVGSGRGVTCANPLPLGSRVALASFPSGKEMVAISGKVDEAVAEGAIGMVKSETGHHALAMNVGGKPVLIPDSSGALEMIGATFSPSLKLLVFARAKLTAAETFAGRVLHDVDAAMWSLEFRLLEAATGRVVASKSVARPGESILPFDIDVKGPASTASVLVQFDKRPIPGQRLRAERNPTPLSMQVFDLSLDKGILTVDEKARENVNESEYQFLTDGLIPTPHCPDAACGPILDNMGRTIECGTCFGNETCVNNLCQLTSKLPNGGKCTPRTQAELCGAGACGKRYDGCSGIIDCGGCSAQAGFVCGQDEPGKCGDANQTKPADVRASFAGLKVCGCFVDERNTNVEVGCDANEVCRDGVCAP